MNSSQPREAWICLSAFWGWGPPELSYLIGSGDTSGTGAVGDPRVTLSLLVLECLPSFSFCCRPRGAYGSRVWIKLGLQDCLHSNAAYTDRKSVV